MSYNLQKGKKSYSLRSITALLMIHSEILSWLAYDRALVCTTTSMPIYISDVLIAICNFLSTFKVVLCVALHM